MRTAFLVSGCLIVAGSLLVNVLLWLDRPAGAPLPGTPITGQEPPSDIVLQADGAPPRLPAFIEADEPVITEVPKPPGGSDITIGPDGQYLEGDPEHLPGAHYALGQLYSDGNHPSFAQDYEAAYAWFLRAAQAGHAGAQFALGTAYLAARGVEQDYAEAHRWYRAAADRGVASAQLNLGVLYAEGLGVRRDYAEALSWFRAAAERGNPEATVNVGVQYMLGRGVERDPSEAIRWYRRAAAKGYARAFALLAIAYGGTADVERDPALEYFWALAADHGDWELAPGRLADLAAALTADQLHHAERRYQACVDAGWSAC